MTTDIGLTNCSHGLERRASAERRTVVHRREEIRFEPTKDDRRSGTDRRKKASGFLGRKL
jgi:hypothetical protein